MSGKSISNLTGIENFTNLEFLSCNNNSLSSLDVSELTNLKDLFCSFNPLNSLNVTGLTSLQALYCTNDSLTSLDVSGLSSLKYLFCQNNSLTSIDVSGLTSLDRLNCSFNSLSSFDVSGLASLQWLDCFDNSLTSLDVSGLTSLKYLFCENNSLFTIDIHSTPLLEIFDASSNMELQCVIVDDVNVLPNNRSVDQGDGIFTTETCIDGFKGLSILLNSMGLASITEAALLAPLKVAETSCTAGKKWMTVATLITFDAMVARLKQLGRLSANEADQILEASGLLQDDILSGAVDCSSGTPYNFLDWITSWYSLDSPGVGDTNESATVYPGSKEIAVYSAPRIYPNPTAGRLTFSHTVNYVEVYNMMGQLLMKAKHTVHLDLHSYQTGVYVIRTMDDDGERNVQKVVKR